MRDLCSVARRARSIDCFFSAGLSHTTVMHAVAEGHVRLFDGLLLLLLLLNFELPALSVSSHGSPITSRALLRFRNV